MPTAPTPRPRQCQPLASPASPESFLVVPPPACGPAPPTEEHAAAAGAASAAKARRAIEPSTRWVDMAEAAAAEAEAEAAEVVEAVEVAISQGKVVELFVFFHYKERIS